MASFRCLVVASLHKLNTNPVSIGIKHFDSGMLCRSGLEGWYLMGSAVFVFDLVALRSTAVLILSRYIRV